MDAFFPGEKRFVSRDAAGRVISERVSGSLDWKARVVCEKCNRGWMSNIERHHAKPAMSDLIKGTPGIMLSPSAAHSIALFAFKTAIVFDYMQRNKAPFFARSVRHQFRESLTIPSTVRMWMAGFVPNRKGHVLTLYHAGEIPSADRFELYVCTYCVGHFVFQVVAVRPQLLADLFPRPGYEGLAVPFFPVFPHDASWPPPDLLQTAREFDGFASRWRVVTVGNPTMKTWRAPR